VIHGVDLYRVQKLARYRSPEMTMRYAHLSPRELRTAVETLDAPSRQPLVATSGETCASRISVTFLVTGRAR
jgi:hypothetical protein